MATYEPLPNALRDSSVLRRIGTYQRPAPTSPGAWPQVVADTITIALGLISIRIPFEGLLSPHNALHEVASSLFSGLMIVTLCAFTGAYSNVETPLNIGGTEGLVKGLCCASLLTILSRVHSSASLDMPGVVMLPSIGLLLIARRELAYVIKRHISDNRLHGAAMLLEGAHERRDYWKTNIDPKLLHETTSPGDLVKRSTDLCIALSLFLLTAPLLLVISMCVKLESRGPAVIRQRRIGMNGAPFYMWKFRSMYGEAARDAPSPVNHKDPRVTKVGRILRRFSIDEIPQLLNVLAGDMSLVGPRPEMPFIVAKYSPYEQLRLHALPGMTGLWQISPARAMPIHQNVDLDIFYIIHRNLFLDIAIMLRTVTAVIRGIGS